MARPRAIPADQRCTPQTLAHVVVEGRRFTGGACNLHLVESHHVQIRRCTFLAPDIASTDPDTHGKNILLDKCHHITIASCRCIAQRPAGDGINIYQSHHVTIANVRIGGPRRRDRHDIGMPIVVDEGSSNVVIRGVRWLPYTLYTTIVIIGRDVLLERLDPLTEIQIGLDDRPVDVGRVIIEALEPSQIAVSPLVRGLVIHNGSVLPAGWRWT